MDLDGKKLATSNLPFQVFEGLIQTQNTFFFKSRKGFFTKSSFCTFADLNHGFGRPWDILWNFLINDSFLIVQKNAFGKKSFEFHALPNFLAKRLLTLIPHLRDASNCVWNSQIVNSKLPIQSKYQIRFQKNSPVHNFTTMILVGPVPGSSVKLWAKTHLWGALCRPINLLMQDQLASPTRPSRPVGTFGDGWDFS